MNHGIPQNAVTAIINLFAMHPEIEKAILYGSRAKGNYKPGSDIDIALSGKNLTHEILSKIIIDLDDLLIPYTVDLSILENISNQELVDHIKRVGYPIFVSTKP